MPRFRLSSQRTEESDMAVRIIEHESGKLSIIRSDIADIEVRNADGTVDKHKIYYDIGGLKLKDFEALASKPKELNIKKLRQEGRIIKERRLLSK
jgi:hypothetical protein